MNAEYGKYSSFIGLSPHAIGLTIPLQFDLCYFTDPSQLSHLSLTYLWIFVTFLGIGYVVCPGELPKAGKIV